MPTVPDARPPLDPSSVVAGSFGIDAFPAAAVRPAAAQLAKGATLEGYVDMDSDLVAPFTIPASTMLSPSVDNMVVPVGLSASHVAFSAIRLEPTWMQLGTVAGTLAGLAMSSADMSMHTIPLLGLQNATTSAGIPTVAYSDINGTHPCATDLWFLGPHGIASSDLYSQNPQNHLSRGRAAHWLSGAVRARNVSVTMAVPPPAPVAPGVLWADYAAGQKWFTEAAGLARRGFVTPAPSSSAFFRPSDHLTTAEWSAWLRLAFPGAEAHRPEANRKQRGSGAPLATVCQAAQQLAAAVRASLKHP